MGFVLHQSGHGHSHGGLSSKHSHSHGGDEDHEKVIIRMEFSETLPKIDWVSIYYKPLMQNCSRVYNT